MVAEGGEAMSDMEWIRAELAAGRAAGRQIANEDVYEVWTPCHKGGAKWTVHDPQEADELIETYNLEAGGDK